MPIKYKTSMITLCAIQKLTLCAMFAIWGLILKIDTSLILSAQRISTCNAFINSVTSINNLVYNA